MPLKGCAVLFKMSMPKGVDNMDGKIHNYFKLLRLK